MLQGENDHANEQEAAWVAERLRGSSYTPEGGLLAALEEQARGGTPIPEEAPGDPASYGFGPPYPEQGVYTGPPPLAPEIWRGDVADDGRGGAPVDSGLPPGALDFSGGTAAPANWEDFKGNTSTGGGFFTIEDLYRRRGEGVPAQFQSGSGMASTNNYRLFGGSPGWIMRNGYIINTNDVNGLYGPYGIGGMGDTPITNPRWRSGAGAGFPAAYAAGSVATSIGGWPGSGVLALLGTPGS